jgi:hypothetical protein
MAATTFAGNDPFSDSNLPPWLRGGGAKIVGTTDAQGHVHLRPEPERHWKTILVIAKGHCVASSHLAYSMEAAAAVDNEDWPIISDMFSAYMVDDLAVGTKVGLVSINKSGLWYLVHPIGDRDYTYWVRSDFLKDASTDIKAPTAEAAAETKSDNTPGDGLAQAEGRLQTAWNLLKAQLPRQELIKVRDEERTWIKAKERLTGDALIQATKERAEYLQSILDKQVR